MRKYKRIWLHMRNIWSSIEILRYEFKVFTFKTQKSLLFFNLRVPKSLSRFILSSCSINLVQDGGGAKRPPISFSTLTSTNVGISTQILLTFSFNPFAILVQNVKAIANASPKLLNLNQEYPSKKLLFLVKSLQNWGYNYFSHRNARVTKLWSLDHIYNIIWAKWLNLVVDVLNRNCNVITFISKCLCFKKT